MVAPLLIALVAAAPTGPVVPERDAAGPPLRAPYVELWTDRDEVVARGERVRVYVRTDLDAFLTVLRVDTDGRVRILFPVDPWDDNYARGGVQYAVSSRHGGYTFRVDDYPGQGYLFAVASLEPFEYGRFVRGNHWDYRAFGEDGRIVGDPYVAFGEILDGILPAGAVDYAYDAVPHSVERLYAYPRFLCYDCHTYVAWPYWDPYHNPCFRFQIVVYDDPYYYPARRVAGTRVVYRTRRTVVPRYVFKDRTPSDDPIVRVRERPVDDAGRRRVTVGATRRVLEGARRVPAPANRETRRPADATRRRVTPTQPPARSYTVPRLERRTPNRAAPQRRTAPAEERRAQPASPPARRTQPARPPERRAQPSRTPPRRAEPQRSPPRRNNPPKRRRGGGGG